MAEDGEPTVGGLIKVISKTREREGLQKEKLYATRSCLLGRTMGSMNSDFLFMGDGIEFQGMEKDGEDERWLAIVP